MPNTQPVGIAYADPIFTSIVVTGKSTLASLDVAGAVTTGGIAAGGSIGVSASGVQQLASFNNGSATTNAFVALGRDTNDTLWGVAGAAGQFMSDTAQGDIIIRTEDAAKALRFGAAGGTTSWASLTSAGLTVTGSITASAFAQANPASASTTNTVTNKIALVANGTVYYLLASTSAA